MRYETRDGAPFKGATAQEAAEALRRISRNPEADLAGYMAATATAARLQTGRDVRSADADEFLDDLEAAGLIRRTD